MRSKLEKKHALTTRNPWAGLMDLQKEMNQLFADLDFPWTQRLEQDFEFAPSCEATETDKEITVKFDIPGMRKDDLKIEVQNNRLSVTGERHEEKTSKEGKQHFSEIFYGSFARSFALPGEIIEDKVEADYQNGVLTVHLPKTEKAKPKKIGVR